MSCPACGVPLVSGPPGARACPACGSLTADVEAIAILRALAEEATAELRKMEASPSALMVRFIGGPLDGREEPVDMATPEAEGGEYHWHGTLELRWKQEG